MNLSLHTATLGIKFLLIFFLARFLVPTEFGLHELLVATLGFSLYLLGYDFDPLIKLKAVILEDSWV